MNRWIMIFMLVTVLMFGFGCAGTKTAKVDIINANALPVPVSGSYVVDSGSASPIIKDSGDSEFHILEVASDNGVKFKVPLLAIQYQKEELIDPDWQISASYSWTDGHKWFLVVQDDYKLATKGNQAYIKFPQKGNGWYWVRVWGRDKKSGKWLWINQYSQYCRNDTKGNPGYEFLVRPATGQSQKVPEDYQTRR